MCAGEIEAHLINDRSRDKSRYHSEAKGTLFNASEFNIRSFHYWSSISLLIDEYFLMCGCQREYFIVRDKRKSDT